MSKAKGLAKLRERGQGFVDDVLNSDTVQTLRNAGLFGVGQGKNPWVDKVDDLVRQSTKTDLNRKFKLKDAPDDVVDAFVRDAQGVDKFWGKGNEIASLAEQHGIEGRNLLDKSLRQVGGTIADMNPLNLMFGTRKSRIGLMHDLWEGGLIGKGSPLQKAITPGESLGKNVEKYKNVMLGREAMPGLKEIGKDALNTTGAVAKPLFLGGAIFPAASIANRVMSPDNNEGALRGSLRDIGWYAGMTTGIPLGVAGVHAGSEVGQRIGDTIGAALETGLGR